MRRMAKYSKVFSPTIREKDTAEFFILAVVNSSHFSPKMSGAGAGVFGGRAERWKTVFMRREKK